MGMTTLTFLHWPEKAEIISNPVQRHSLPNGRAILHKTDHNKWQGWQGCGRNRDLHTVLLGCKIVWPLWKTVRQFLKTFNIELPHFYASVHAQEKSKHHSSITYYSPKVETSQLSISWQMDKQNIVYSYYGILVSNLKNWTTDTRMSGKSMC